jgi:hypothetical protein
MAVDQEVIDQEWNKKYKDVYRKGITSIYWGQILDIIKFLEDQEEYEKCQDLWDYYLEITGKGDKKSPQ